MTQGKVTITDVATLILSADTQRRSFWLQNTSLTTGAKIYLGFDTSVSTNNPFLAPTGSFDRNLARDYKGAIYGITETGLTGTISYIDF